MDIRGPGLGGAGDASSGKIGREKPAESFLLTIATLHKSGRELRSLCDSINITERLSDTNATLHFLQARHHSSRPTKEPSNCDTLHIFIPGQRFTPTSMDLAARRRGCSTYFNSALYPIRPYNVDLLMEQGVDGF